MKYKVFGKILKEYRVVEVEGINRKNAKYIATQKYSGFEPLQCVSSEWSELFDKYIRYWDILSERGLFSIYDDSDMNYTCNGYDICLNSLFCKGYVLLHADDDLSINIGYLNDEEFERIVEYMEIHQRIL